MDENEIEDMLGVCSLNTRRLTTWEIQFIDSVAEQWEEKRWLSEKQQEILNRIYSKV